ncbi:unnamed protein product [Ambrosiozyma monospora]|uniref:Unnamed protein product n=1 Tax=Ambrosiozyma monospora TaxID=43982 RepID=A0ACB5T556_AMBMO|nr:unnamed protein product [Ambrosiozyma monospora]
MPVASYYPISNTTTNEGQVKTSSTRVNGQASSDKPVQIKVKDENNNFPHNNNGDCDNRISQEADNKCPGLVPPLSPEEILMMSKVTESLMIGQEKFSNSGDLNGFKEDIAELMYYTDRLYDAVH